MLSFYDSGDYLAIAKHFNVSYEQTYSQLVTRDCLVLLLGRLMEKRIVDPDDLVKVLHYDDDIHLEAFLKASIVE